MARCSPELCGWVELVPPAEQLGARRLQADVWYCDDDCGCSEANIVLKEPYRVGIAVWTGEFRIDHESGATTDLNRMGKHLRRHHHDLYSLISWPWLRRVA